MLVRIRSEFQYLQKWGQNSNASKDKIRIPIFTKMGAEFHVRKDMVRFAMFTKIGPEFQ